MGINEDAKLLISFLEAEGVKGPDDVKPGWSHIGAIALDAAIQPQRDYEKAVRPRVERLIVEHPEAATTSGFLDLSENEDLTEVVNYSYTERVNLAVQIARTFCAHEIETVEDLQETLNGEESKASLQRQLHKLRLVGPKTLGYIDILAGSADGVAIDSRVIRVLTDAGISHSGYEHAEAVIRAAAAKLGWPAGGLDAVLWRTGKRTL